nr:hypothetical protein [Cytophagales bacterium]
MDPREGVGMFNTYNANIPFFRYPLDHVFYSKEFALTRMEKLENIGSDHFSIYIELTFEPETGDFGLLEEVAAESEEKKADTIQAGK